MVLLGLLGALSVLPWSPTFASYWRDLVATHSSYDLSSWGSYVIVLLAFFPTGLAFLAIDRLGWLSRYKIQADAHVTPSQLGKLALNLLINFGITLVVESHLIIGRATAAGTHCNFGILGLLDRLHGTDTKWQAAVQARAGQAYVRWSRKRKAVVESPYPVEERAHPKAD